MNSLLLIISLVVAYILIFFLINKKHQVTFLESVFISFSMMVLYIGVFSTFLAYFGLFKTNSILLALFVKIFILLILTIKYKKLKSTNIFKNIKVELLILSLSFLMIFINAFFSSEHVVKGKVDPNAYISIAYNLSETGHLFLNDPFNFFPKDLNEHLFGVYQFKKEDFGNYLPNFLHLYPVLMAIVIITFGLMQSLYLNAIIGSFSTIGLYLLARKLFSDKSAIISFIIFIFNFAQIYWSRSQFPEILAQLFFITSCLLYTYKKSDIFSFFSGLFLGAMLLCRLEFIFFPIPLFLFFLFNNKSVLVYAKLIIGFILTYALGIIHTISLSKYYAINLFKRESYEIFKYFPNLFKFLFDNDFIKDIDWYLEIITNNNLNYQKLTMVLLVTSILFILFILYIRKKYFSLVNKNHRNPAIILAILWLIFMLWNLSFRRLYFNPPEGINLFNYTVNYIGFDSINLVRLTYFLTPLGIVLMIFAIFYQLIINKKEEFWFISSISLFFIFSFIIRAPITPPLPWWSRKYISVIIPFMLIFIGYAIDYLGKLINKKHYKLIIFLIFINYFLIIPQIIFFKELKGSHEQLLELTSNFSNNELVVFSENRAAKIFFRPLLIIYNLQSVMLKLNSQEPDLKILYDLSQKIDEKIIYVSEKGEIAEDYFKKCFFINYFYAQQISYVEIRHSYLDLNINKLDSSFNLVFYELVPKMTCQL